jgi:hypothetical protein
VENEAFSTRGGIWIADVRAKTWGSSFGRIRKTATWPFAKLQLGREQITISSLFGPFLVTRENLVSITVFGGLTGKGVRFEVNDSRDVVVFWPFRFGRVLSDMRSQGWVVDEGD